MNPRPADDIPRVLHLTNWYPNARNPIEGIFIRDQIKLFSTVSEASVVHLTIVAGSKLYAREEIRLSDFEESIRITIPTGRALAIDLVTAIEVRRLLRLKAGSYDLLHVHIAYPLLVFRRLWRALVSVPIMISEHWSAYHFNFYVPREKSQRLDRIRRIFTHEVPLITVSGALRDDVLRFAGLSQNACRTYVIPNAIDTGLFDRGADQRDNTVLTLFLVNFWRDIKNPFPLFDAIRTAVDQGVRLKLVVGGFGPLVARMKDHIDRLDLSDRVVFTGKMSKSEIATALRSADAYAITSEYETFSVACAEALCVGVPLIGTAIPAIREYADERDMVTVSANNSAAWTNALLELSARNAAFDRDDISRRARARFDSAKIIAAYQNVLTDALRGIG